MPEFAQPQRRGETTSQLAHARFGRQARDVESRTPFPGAHQVVGNQALQRLLRQRTIQAKLRIGPPGDSYEEEADRLADVVMRMPDPLAYPSRIGPALPAPMSSLHIQRMCAACQEEEDEELVQPKRGDHETGRPVPERSDAQAITPRAGTPFYLHRDPSASAESSPSGSNMAGDELGVMPRFLQSRTSLAAALGESTGAQPLTPDIREQFERSLQTDLSGVRVHTDHRADRLARVLDSEAFTNGSDIYFRAGRYNPSSHLGVRLLAHETAHTVQQSHRSTLASTGTPAQSECRVGSANDPLERDADHAAELMTSPQTSGQSPNDKSQQYAPHGRTATHLTRFASPVIQRQESPPEAKSTGLESYLPGLIARAKEELRQKAKQQLDQLIARIKQKRELRLRVQTHVNALEFREFFGESLDERERDQLEHLTGRLQDLKKEIEDLQQQAIEKAIVAYDIDTSMVASIRRADNEELFSLGVPKYGELAKTGEVSIYGGAFDSAAKLGSVIGHEAEAHGSQVVGRRGYVGREGERNLGYTINEIEARDYEIRNAERFGTSAEHIAKTKEFRETLVKTLPPDYQARVNQGSYDLKPEDLANEEIKDRAYGHPTVEP